MKTKFNYIYIKYLTNSPVFLGVLCLVIFSNSIQATNSTQTYVSRDTDIIQKIDDVVLKVFDYNKSIIIDLCTPKQKVQNLNQLKTAIILLKG